MITIGYSSVTENRIHNTLICGCCGKYLGSYNVEDEKEYNEIEAWLYCPFCGQTLNQNSHEL